MPVYFCKSTHPLTGLFIFCGLSTSLALGADNRTPDNNMDLQASGATHLVFTTGSALFDTSPSDILALSRGLDMRIALDRGGKGRYKTGDRRETRRVNRQSQINEGCLKRNSIHSAPTLATPIWNLGLSAHFFGISRDPAIHYTALCTIGNGPSPSKATVNSLLGKRKIIGDVIAKALLSIASLENSYSDHAVLSTSWQEITLKALKLAPQSLYDLNQAKSLRIRSQPETNNGAAARSLFTVAQTRIYWTAYLSKPRGESISLRVAIGLVPAVSTIEGTVIGSEVEKTIKPSSRQINQESAQSYTF